jgi:hypothetical protein
MLLSGYSSARRTKGSTQQVSSSISQHSCPTGRGVQRQQNNVRLVKRVFLFCGFALQDMSDHWKMEPGYTYLMYICVLVCVCVVDKMGYNTVCEACVPRRIARILLLNLRRSLESFGPFSPPGSHSPGPSLRHCPALPLWASSSLQLARLSSQRVVDLEL